MAKKRSAKGQFVATKKRRKNPDTPVPLLGNPRKRRVHRRKNPAALMGIGNPPPMTDLVEFILPGFAGYAATKFVARVTHAQLSKKFPKAGKHLAAASTVGSAAAAWFLVHRIKRIQKYHTPVVVGASIAALQTLVRLYLPKYGWIVADAPLTETPLLSSANVEHLFPGGPEVVSDDGLTRDSEPDDGSTDVDDMNLGGLGSLGSGGLGADDLSN